MSQLTAKPDDKLKVREAAQLLGGFSNQFVYDLIKEGKLNAIRVGKRALRVLRSDLEQYLLAQATGSAPGSP